MSLSAIITNALAEAASQMTNQVLHEAIARLATRYGFDFAEAIKFVNVAPARPEVLKKKDLPWCEVINTEWCCGITSRGGLYTQCPKAIDPASGGGLCGLCAKQITENGSLKYGSVNDRLAAEPFDFQGGKVTPFSKVMEKNGWSKELVERSAAEYGLTVPVENFVAPKPKRGRKVTRPVMETPEPEAPVVRIMVPDSYDPTEPEAPVVWMTEQENDETDSLTLGMAALAVDDEEDVPPTHSFITYNATDPSSSDEELEEEAPVTTATVTEKVKKSPKIEGEKKEKKPRAPKADGEKKEKKPRAPKADGEKKEKKPRAPKADGEKKKGKSPVESPVGSPVVSSVVSSVASSVASSVESPVESPVASSVVSSVVSSVESSVVSSVVEVVESKKVNGSPPSDSESSSSSVPELNLGAAEEPRKKKTPADYSAITPVEAATIKPMALRTACLQHGIELETKSIETLRAELITKVTP